MNAWRSLLRLLAASVLAVLLTLSAHAHEPGLSVAELRATGATLGVRISYSFSDVRRWLPPYTLPAGVEKNPETARTALEAVRPLALELWQVRAGGTILAAECERAEFVAGENVAFHLLYRLPAGSARPLTVTAGKLGALTAAHRELVRVLDATGKVQFETTLTAAQPTASLAWAEGDSASLRGTPAAIPSAQTFFVLGVEHIWTGYDHLLFLFALLVAARSLRSVVVIISCFTLAHSLTLGMATLGWVWLPPAFVEPAIAASIVFVGVENLFLRGQEPRHRGWLTFAFGLVHGFGFASVLRDLGVGNSGRGLAGPLVMFNLGVEAGQLCVAVLALPLLAYLSRSEVVRQRGGVAASVLVSLAGLYWLAARTVLG